MKLHVALLCIVFTFNACLKDKEDKTIATEPVLTKAQMLEDFEIFQSIFEEANAGLYKYRSQRQVDSLFAVKKKQIKFSDSYRAFYNHVWEVIDFTGSCHNSLSYPENIDTLLNFKPIFFPVPIKYIAGKIYTNVHLDMIPVGSEILAINGASASKVIDVLSKYVSTDGYNTTGKYANIETDWMPFYMYLGFGESTTFKMRYRDTTSQSIQTVILPAVSYDDFMKNYNQRHSKLYDNRYKADYQYEYIKDIHSGFLRVSTFAVGGQKSEGHKAYARFLETVFTDLKQSKTQNLIVDIRGNGGGNDPNDLLLYAYLTQRNFRENTKAFTLFQEIPFPDYYIDDDIDELPLELKEEHRVLKNAKYYQHADFNKVWSPKENAFKGNIYLLIDPYVASAASLFASLVKSDSTTMVIGEESLGGYYGHTGHIPVNYELPNSKLVLTFSIVDLEQDVQKLPDQSYGDGVKPDWSVSQTYQDFITHRDTQLEYVIKMITTHNVL